MKMYDIVIPLGTGGHKTGDTDLRFALRSIDKHLSGYNNIFLIGERPAWVKNVCWISCKDIKLRKQLNLMNKLMEAAREETISEDFIYWHDDHFLLKPLIAEDIKVWYDNTIIFQTEKAEGKYKTACENTMGIIDGLYYDIHVPCIFNKYKLGLIYKENWKEKEFIIKSLYFNRFNCDLEYMKDLKINRVMSKEAVEEHIKDRLFMSTGPNGMRGALVNKMKDLFPARSMFEK